jgi:hypothetical protein
VLELLQSPESAEFPVENRLLAALALSDTDAALGLARLVTELDRPLNAEEIRVLASNFQQPAVAAMLKRALVQPESTLATLRALLSVRTQIDTFSLNDAIDHAMNSIWSSDSSTDNRRLLIEMAGAFRVRSLETSIAELAGRKENDRELRLAALRSLREIGVSHSDILMGMVGDEADDSLVRLEALAAMAESRATEVLGDVASLLPMLQGRERQECLERLAAHGGGAETVVQAIDSGVVADDEISLSVLESLSFPTARLLKHSGATWLTASSTCCDSAAATTIM